MKKALVLSAVLALAPILRAAPAKRVVTLIPSHSAIVVDLGARESLVGVSNAENDDAYPGVPRVGGIQPDWESMVALKPDIVLADTSHERHRDTFARLGVPVAFLPGTTVADFEGVFDIMRRIAEIVGRSEEAERRIAGLRDRVAAAQARIPGVKRPRVYFEIWPKPIQGAAPISLRGHLLESARAENILPDTKNLTAMVSLEWIPRRAPDVILHTGVVKTEEIVSRPGWSQVPAVRNGRVYVVDRDRFSQAAPAIVQAFEELIDILYGKAQP